MRHLGGEITLDEARELIELTTRQLVRKQMKWFRRDERIQWIEGSSSELLEQALAVAQEG